MNSKRTEFAKFTLILFYSNLISIMSINEKVDSNFKILTTFEPITWWILLISMLLISSVNIKTRRNFLINYIKSLLDHFECLLTKQSKCNFNPTKTNYFMLKLVPFHQTEFTEIHICYGL